MPNFNLDDYEPVEDRLARFWADHPKGRVRTELLASAASNEWVVFAEIYRDSADAVPFATGLAHEVIGQGMVNRTSALENCETSALGRALANGGYAPKGKRPSREEMAKAAQSPSEPQKGPSNARKAAQSAPVADPETAVKAEVLRRVQVEFPLWTEQMVKDHCARLYPVAVRVSELAPSAESAGVLADTVIDLIKTET